MDEERQHYCGTCGEDCEGVCKHSGEATIGVYATEEYAAEYRERIPFLTVGRKLKERKRELLDWLIDEAEANGLWLWAVHELKKRSARCRIHYDSPPRTNSGDIDELISKHSVRWYSPSELRAALQKNPEMYYWLWAVARPQERLKSLRQTLERVEGEIVRFQ